MMGQGKPAYPATRMEPRGRAIGEVAFDDPYVWLEDESSEVLEWQRAQTRLAIATITSWPDFEAVRVAVADAHIDTTLTAPARYGDVWFQLRTVERDDEFASVVVSDQPCGAGRVLLNPTEWTRARGVPVGLDCWFPSPRGAFVVYGTSEGDSEQTVLRVIEVATGRDLSIEIEHAWSTSVAWLPDESGFMHTVGTEAPTAGVRHRVALRRLNDTGPVRPIEIDGLTAPVPAVQISDDGNYVVVTTDRWFSPKPLFYCELADMTRWLPVDLPDDMLLVGAAVGDRYVGLTTDGAPNGRVVSVPLANASDREAWIELIPEGSDWLRTVTISGGRILTHRLGPAGRQSIHAHLADGTFEAALPLPTGGCLGGRNVLPFTPFCEHKGDDVTAVHRTPNASPCVHHVNLATMEVQRLTEPARTRDDLTVRRLSATAADGTSLTYTLIHRVDLDTSVPHPVLVHGYGGFNVAWIPTYVPHAEPFIDAGGIYVLANLRGGADQGDEWRFAGRRQTKQTTFDDLYATAEDLIARGVTEAGRLALMGESNGGVLACVAVTQRPDLWRAVVPMVPLTDLLSLKRDPVSDLFASFEYGDPDVPHEADWVYAYSPYHHVTEGVSYPAVLLIAGDRDVRCPPWHSRKMAARLQGATNGAGPVLLRVHSHSGHGLGTPASVDVLKAAESTAFAMAAVGLRAAQRTPVRQATVDVGES